MENWNILYQNILTQKKAQHRSPLRSNHDFFCLYIKNFCQKNLNFLINELCIKCFSVQKKTQQIILCVPKMLEEHIIPLAKYNWLILLNSWSILSVCNNIACFYIFYFICIDFSWTKAKSPFYSFLERHYFQLPRHGIFLQNKYL